MPSAPEIAPPHNNSAGFLLLVNKNARAIPGNAACVQGTRNFIIEVDVSWGVNQIKKIRFTIIFVEHRSGLSFNGDATFFFYLEFVHELFVTNAVGQCSSKLKQAIR